MNTKTQKYNASEKARENRNRYSKTDKGKVAYRKYRESDKYKKSSKIYRISKTFNISYEEYILEMNNGCYICGSHKKMVLDHCHTTGKIRNALCFSCNVALGLLKDSQKLLVKAANYIENPPYKHIIVDSIGQRKKPYVSGLSLLKEKECHYCNKILPYNDNFFPSGGRVRNLKTHCRECDRKILGARRYKISIEEYNKLISTNCFICETYENICVDHCHDTNKIRGSLCKTCNSAIGHFKNDPLLLKKAADYVNSHKNKDEK